MRLNGGLGSGMVAIGLSDYRVWDGAIDVGGRAAPSGGRVN